MSISMIDDLFPNHQSLFVNTTRPTFPDKILYFVELIFVWAISQCPPTMRNSL
jgi:hypothetical protein